MVVNHLIAGNKIMFISKDNIAAGHFRMRIKTAHTGFQSAAVGFRTDHIHNGIDGKSAAYRRCPGPFDRTGQDADNGGVVAVQSNIIQRI